MIALAHKTARTARQGRMVFKVAGELFVGACHGVATYALHGRKINTVTRQLQKLDLPRL